MPFFLALELINCQGLAFSGQYYEVLHKINKIIIQSCLGHKQEITEESSYKKTKKKNKCLPLHLNEIHLVLTYKYNYDFLEVSIM